MAQELDFESQKIGEVKKEESSYEKWEASDREKELMKHNRVLFRLAAEQRNQSFANFDGMSLIPYIEDSYQRYNTNVNIRDDIEDWQSIVHDGFTRNKVNAILAKVISVLPIAEVVGRGDEDMSKGLIMSNLYEYSEDVDDYDKFMVSWIQEAIIKGTAIGYEGQETRTRKVRNVKGSGDDITVSEGEIKENKLFAQVVKLEDFYPASIGIGSVKEQPRCFWRNVMYFQQFEQDFSMFDKSKYVEPHKTTYGENEPRPYYQDYISDDVQDGQVEVIRRYDRDNDQFIIEANCVWLNPIVTKDGTEEICPLPFNHKELPFFDIKYQQFSSDFFYGKSLPDNLKSMQDVLDVLTNMLLDQSFLTIFPPMLTNGFDSIEDDYLRPGRRTPVDTGGLPINQAFMKLDLGTPGNWHQFILNYTRTVMEESSMDKVSSGQAGAGDRTTAQEIRVAAEGVSAMLGLFGRWVKYGVKRKAYLRTKNIAQYWMDANSPMVEQIGGEGASAEANKAFNTFKIDSAVLSNGKRGSKIIEIYKNKEDMPTAAQQKIKSDIYELSNNRKIEYVAIEASYIPNMDFDIKLVPSTKNDTNKDMEKALQLEKDRVYLSFFGDMVNREELLAQTAEKMGDDPAKIIKEDVLNPQSKESNPMMDKGANPNPEGNVAQNAVQGMMGGKNEMQQLSNNMLG
ncbi:head-tail connector protein [Candidatus Dojkabacteria bacterium]|jgi:hypothetical protein|nr:head-tail connector protein [Candidatus Dojkabacteria bacterium]